MPSVYLAGFDVFYPDALARGDYLKALCATHGLEGLYPLDATLPEGLSDPAGWICQANLDSLRRADAVLANLGEAAGAGAATRRRKRRGAPWCSSLGGGGWLKRATLLSPRECALLPRGCACSFFALTFGTLFYLQPLAS